MPGEGGKVTPESGCPGAVAAGGWAPEAAGKPGSADGRANPGIGPPAGRGNKPGSGALAAGGCGMLVAGVCTAAEAPGKPGRPAGRLGSASPPGEVPKGRAADALGKPSMAGRVGSANPAGKPPTGRGVIAGAGCTGGALTAGVGAADAAGKPGNAAGSAKSGIGLPAGRGVMTGSGCTGALAAGGCGALSGGDCSVAAAGDCAAAADGELGSAAGMGSPAGAVPAAGEGTELVAGGCIPEAAGKPGRAPGRDSPVLLAGDCAVLAAGGGVPEAAEKPGRAPGSSGRLSPVGRVGKVSGVIDGSSCSGKLVAGGCAIPAAGNGDSAIEAVGTPGRGSGDERPLASGAGAIAAAGVSALEAAGKPPRSCRRPWTAGLCAAEAPGNAGSCGAVNAPTVCSVTAGLAGKISMPPAAASAGDEARGAAAGT